MIRFRTVRTINVVAKLAKSFGSSANRKSWRPLLPLTPSLNNSSLNIPTVAGQFRLVVLLALLAASVSHSVSNSAEPDSLAKTLCSAKRIVFLGDSITYQGGYVVEVEAFLYQQACLQSPPLTINVGLSSETVSGLSEEGHAGGRFPRPDLFERLDRVLDSTKPDFVFACYGMNCGIYQPLESSRYAAYQKGINRLRETLRQRGISLVLVTPPVFDGQVAVKQGKFDYPQYDEVLTAYSEWLLTLRDEGQWVIDLHGPMAESLAARRGADPEFTFQRDAVHPNQEGHFEIAKAIIAWLREHGVESAASTSASGTKQQSDRMRLLRDAYLSDAGHQRPGVKAGLPVEEALRRHREIGL